MDAWHANTKQFTEATGVEVRVDNESWEDVRPKAAVAANVGAGPDIILLDRRREPVSGQAARRDRPRRHLGKKYGGWYDGPKGYAMRDGKWIGLPLGAAGTRSVYRESQVKAAGFESSRRTPRLPQALQGAEGEGHTRRLRARQRDRRRQHYAHWLLWSHGGKMVDENNKVAINSPETLKALEYAKELYATFIPGTLCWLDSTTTGLPRRPDRR